MDPLKFSYHRILTCFEGQTCEKCELDFSESLTVCRKFVKFSGEVFCLILTKMGFEWYFITFQKFSNHFPKIFWQVHGGYTIKHSLTFCSFHTENFWTLVFVRTSFHSVRTSELRSDYFEVWTSRLINKSILFLAFPVILNVFLKLSSSWMI